MRKFRNSIVDESEQNKWVNLGEKIDDGGRDQNKKIVTPFQTRKKYDNPDILHENAE